MMDPYSLLRWTEGLPIDWHRSVPLDLHRRTQVSSKAEKCSCIDAFTLIQTVSSIAFLNVSVGSCEALRHKD